MKLILYTDDEKQAKLKLAQLHASDIRGFIKSMWFLGVREKGRRYYWKLFISTLVKYPRSFPLSISLSIFGFHFRKVAEKYISTPTEDTPALKS